MVLTNRSTAFVEPTCLDINRTLALAAAIALNVSALLLLSLVGVAPVSPLKAVAEPTYLIPDWIRAKPIEPEILPVPAPPSAPVRPTPRQASVRTTPVETTQVVEASVVVVESSTLPVVEEIGSGVVGMAAASRAATVAYGDASPPPYPAAALKRGLEGLVTLAVLVAADGSVEQIRVQRSSGHRVLDREALRHVREHWRFQPAWRDGQAVSAWASVPVEFTIAR